METIQFRAMNTDVLLAAEGQPDQLDEGFQAARGFIQQSEIRFSRFSEESELSQLNRSAGKWFQASPHLFEVIGLALRFFHLTRGLFDPSILPDLKRLGYDKSMDLLREKGAAPLFESLLGGDRPSFIEMDLDEDNQRIMLPTGMELDLGGIAKGWIAERASILLSKYAPTCAVNAGGDMFLLGLPQGQNRWPVELEDPFKPEKTLTLLAVKPGGVATSTVTKRTWKQGNKKRHHLIDPRSGMPARSAWVSVTVMAQHAYEAEVFAKALLIAGPEQAQEIARNSGINFYYVAVDRNKKIWGAQRNAPQKLEVAYAA
jgi:thiamine biosynthesis lipoprotein